MLAGGNDTMTQDEEHLNMLAIFHYIVGGMTALLSCIPFIHVGIGVAMVCGGFDGKNPPPPAIGWIFIILGSIFILVGWTLSTAIIIAGRKLKQRKSRMYCLVVAGIECMIMPFGTILGVFTLVVLMKEPVREIFTAAHGQP